MQYLILAPRNLEDVAAGELRRKNIKVAKSQYRKIIIDYDKDPNTLNSLKAPDDVLVFLGNFKDVGHYSGLLDDLCKNLKKLNIDKAIETVKKIREIPEDAKFSVTVSTVGERHFTQDYLKDKIGKTLTKKNLTYRKEGVPDLDFFLLIENEDVFFGLRLFKDPLHKRAFKRYSMPASLKSNIAYAMLELIDLNQEDLFLDPMCGVGSISIEAAFMGAKAFGYDINKDAIKLAVKNAKKAEKEITFEVRDATKTGLKEGSIDKIATNLPFGRQITVDSNTKLFKNILIELKRIIKKSGKIALLSIHSELLKKLAKNNDLKLIHEREISLYGLSPKILIFRRAWTPLNPYFKNLGSAKSNWGIILEGLSRSTSLIICFTFSLFTICIKSL